ncbi:hypothetical protein FRB95_000386 [Tulasnella sp. JGI-2019a]|nr:hypothetical protein FRB95_000386 [Tulasnella sp. JGI-2019a]
MGGTYNFILKNETPLEFIFKKFDTDDTTLDYSKANLNVYPGGEPRMKIKQEKGENSGQSILPTSGIYYKAQGPDGVKMDNSKKKMWLSLKMKKGEVPVPKLYYADTYKLAGNDVDFVKIIVERITDFNDTKNNTPSYDQFTLMVVPFEDAKNVKGTTVFLPNPLHPVLNEKNAAPDFISKD